MTEGYSSSPLSPSRIQYMPNPDTSNREQRRQGHLMALLPLSRLDSATGERSLQDFRVYVELSAFLAFKHIQRRDAKNVLPDLAKRLEGCDFSWTYRHHDTQFSPLQAARELLSYDLHLGDDNDNSGGSSEVYSGTENSSPTDANWEIENIEQQEEGQATVIATRTTAPLQSQTTSTLSPAFLANSDYWNTPASSPAVEKAPIPSTPTATTFVPATPEDSPIMDDTLINNNLDGWDISLPPPDNNDGSTVIVAEPKPQAPRPQRTAAPFRTDIPLSAPLLTFPPGMKKSIPDAQQTRDPKLRRARQLQQQSQQQLQPFAVLGAARSAVSQAVSILGAAWELPQISSSSTASTLDDSPFFARTVPTNEGDAHATIFYLTQELQITHAAVLFVNDSWGRRYEQDLRKYATQYGMTLRSVPYEGVSGEELEGVMVQLQQTKLSYFIGILNPSAWKPVVKKAHEFGIMGHTDFTWFLGDLVELVDDNFALDRETESDIALALHGSAVVFLQVTPHVEFDRALADVANDPELQQEFIGSHSEPALLENFTFSNNPGRSLFQYLTYDAVVALGITACETPGQFLGQEFYDQLLKVDFKGVSGRVLLHNSTGTRLGDSLRYQIVNMVRNDFISAANVSSGTISFATNISSQIELSPPTSMNTSGDPMLETVEPFIYFGNGTEAPLGLPYLEENLNLIPDPVLYTGLAMGILVMLLSMGFGIWTYYSRNSYVVRASQPVFLIQLCVGVFIVASTIIPLGFQEPRPGLDTACMSVPWLFCIGFTAAISALFSKAKRINQLMNSGIGFRRIQVKPRDVMRPCFILMCVNLVILTAWSASPWRISWHRISVDNNVDQFGRTVESYGVCRANSKWHFVLSVPLVLCNAAVLLMATYQSYIARDLPVELSETLYLSASLVSLSEIFLLGINVIFAVINQPAAFYLVSCIVLCLGCLSFLLPVFLPKYWQRNAKAPRGRMSTSVITRRPNHSGNSASALGSGVSAPYGSALSSAPGSGLSTHDVRMSSSCDGGRMPIRRPGNDVPSLQQRFGPSSTLPFGSIHGSSAHGSSNPLAHGSGHAAPQQAGKSYNKEATNPTCSDNGEDPKTHLMSAVDEESSVVSDGSFG